MKSKCRIHAGQGSRTATRQSSLARWLCQALLLAGAALVAAGPARAVSLADQPLFTNTAVPGNLALALSVEFPTAVSMAHRGAFNAAATDPYLGYFDPEKCYRYKQGTEDEETGTDISHFEPVGMATSRKCTATGLTDTWSGNFLNWMTMQAIDPFRWALTGGYRRVDTTSATILERAWASSLAGCSDGTNGCQGQDSNFPLIPQGSRPSPSSTDIADHTPLSDTALKVSVLRRGNQVYITGATGTLSNPTPGATAASSTHYSQAATTLGSTVYSFYARVKVCEAATSPVAFSRETNCVAYEDGRYKPEGLIQKYSEKIRFSVFGYLNDPTDSNRDGGVLRAKQKFVGPMVTNPGSASTTNSATEWSASTGVMGVNPDSTDASTTATAFGVTVGNSGVVNYLNKFGQQQKTYKRRDPVSELYYGVLRYFKNQGNVSAWTNIGSDANKERLIDGFPVITTWDDPIQYSCQRNFVLGIGDTNTNWDWNVPGSTGGGNEPTDPPELAEDTTVDAKTATNKVGSLQGLGSSLGTTAISNGSYLMAGLAYHANTQDIRPDNTSVAKTIGKQTLQTYWLDVLEFGSYAANNPYYLAAKYGGFKVPSGYDMYGQSTALPDAWWRTTTDTTPNGDARPDNYYTVDKPDQMVAGLQKAFASIAAALQAYTTSFSTALPQVAISGNASFAAKFDSENWTGEVAANELAFDAVTGAPSQTPAWSFSTKLATQLSGTGWNDNRRVVTWDPVAADGVAFRSSGTSKVSTTQLAALDTSYGTGDDSVNYLNYLRGDRQHEQGSTVTGSTQAYRKRTGLLGDVVGSKARPVGQPSLLLSNASNPGYGAFKTQWTTTTPRPTVVYVGANDGMLHAIHGALSGTDAGKEIFAYIPSALFDGPTSTPGTNGLAALGNPTFTHRYFVNATPAAFDIDFNKTHGASGTADWHTVLIGGLGKGGRSYYALDITDPAGITSEATAAAKVLWEFSDADMGYTYGEPTVVKTAKYGWVVMFTSGYNNTGEDHIFIVNPKTGALLEKISTGESTGGLAHMNAFVVDRTDGTADAAYAGDVQGNLWRLDLTPTGTAPVYTAPTLIATLANAASQVQAVTTRPLIETDPKTGRRFVLVGTGIMLDNTHIGSAQQQSFYAIVDGRATRFNESSDLPTGVSFPITRSMLADNTDLLDGIAYNLSNQIGWYIELGTGASGTVGWRVVSDPSAAFGIVTFASTLPNGDVCNPSGSSRIYAVNFGTGKSVLTSSGDTFINYSTAVTGVVTDLRFFTVNGVPRLIAGSDTGELKAPPGQFSQVGTIRRLNWREVPLAN